MGALSALGYPGQMTDTPDEGGGKEKKGKKEKKKKNKKRKKEKTIQTVYSVCKLG